MVEKERATPTPTNDSANNINSFLLNKLTTKHAKYESVDSVMEAEDAVHYPVEFLNTLNPPGIPPHVLNLKIGAPIMLLRNVSPPKLCVCNGTKLQVKNLHNKRHRGNDPNRKIRRRGRIYPKNSSDTIRLPF
ncbi:ATP-dependent DNA helicase [Trichonephila clavipes]|nr:ATP-dependent DNA helicase [Trichonephila clavipes]